MKRVLVTGASGFIGRRVIDRLVESGLEVHATHVEPSPPPLPTVRWHEVDLLSCRLDAVREIGATDLLHLAWYAEHGKFWRSPENLSWVAASLALVRAFQEGGGRRATFVGTCAEYDWGSTGLLKETVTPLRPSTLYGVAKDALRRLVEAYAVEAGLSWAWGRVFFLYGPGEDPRRFVGSVVHNLLTKRMAPMSHGRQVRDFLHVDDVARALVALADSDVQGPVNIASGVPTTLAEVAEVVRRHAGGSLAIGSLPVPAGEPPSLVGDVTRLRDEVGFRPRLGLEDGIASMVRELQRSSSE